MQTTGFNILLNGFILHEWHLVLCACILRKILHVDTEFHKRQPTAHCLLLTGQPAAHCLLLTAYWQSKSMYGSNRSIPNVHTCAPAILLKKSA
jgi:hypothetical protein